MANTPTPHFPTFRVGDTVLFEIEVRNREAVDYPPYEPPGGVVISLWLAGTTVIVSNVPMTLAGPGVYRYQWDTTGRTAGVYTAEMIALSGNQNQQSQIYAVVKLVA